jgi:hypothetical protein
MRMNDFKEATENLQKGDFIQLTLRGNYTTYTRLGHLKKIEDGRIYLDHGLSHSYKRIMKIFKLKDREKESDSS